MRTLKLGPWREGSAHDPQQTEVGAPDTLVDASAVPPEARTSFRTLRPSLVAKETEAKAADESPPRYEVAHVLGRGGMGEVLLAEDRDVGRKVAIKHVHTNNPTLHARFVDEVRMMGRLEHPNIASVYDVDQDADGGLFLTMRYVEGETLHEVLERLRAGHLATHRAFPLARRLDIFEGILNALSHAHVAGVLHRDVKPGNVMLGASGAVFVTDWGIAVTTDHAPDPHAPHAPRAREGEVMGTPSYMSPEQARGELVDPRSDVYSAFVLLFELLTLGRYRAPTRDVDRALLDAAMAEPPWVFGPAYGSTVGGQQPVPLEYRHYLVHGLANDRTRRYASAQDALATLHGIRSGEIAIECPVTFMKAIEIKLHRWMARAPMLGMGVMMVMLVVAALGVRHLLVRLR